MRNGVLWRVAALLAPLALGAEASAQTLNEALEVAYTSNPTIQAERARLGAVKTLRGQALAGALPQITAGGSYTQVESDQTINTEAFGGVGSVQNSFSLTTLAGQVQGELVLFDGFRNLNAVRLANARIRAGGAQLAGIEQDVLQRAASAYFDVVRDTGVYEANRNNVQVLLRQKDEAALRFEVGEVTRTDVAQAEARFERARAQLTSAQAQLAVSRAAFAELIGDAPGTLEASPALPPLPETLEAAHLLARSYAPAIIAAREAEQASRRQIAIARSALSPQVSATASYQYADEPSTFVLRDEQFAYGIRATAPIFLGGLNISRVKEAKANNEADRIRIIEAERRVAAAVTGAWEQLGAARANIVSAAAQSSASALALEGVRREAQLGARTTLDVLDAEQEFLNARVALANAERDARVATFGLLAATGMLTLDGSGDWSGTAAEPSSPMQTGQPR